ncbi:MAG TPA: hypothetical protein VIN11_04665 [Roseivirga sp.]
MINRVIIILLSSISLLPLKAQDFQVVTGKSVIIDGVTSFGRFACDYETVDEADTIRFRAGLVRETPVMDINLPVDQFGCGNKMLNRDFNKTLQSEEYPYIHVLVEQFFRDGESYYSSLRLKLVGKELYMEKLPFVLLEDESGKFLKAEFALNLNYFDLTPPKKFLGLLKVHEELNIRLELELDN